MFENTQERPNEMDPKRRTQNDEEQEEQNILCGMMPNSVINCICNTIGPSLVIFKQSFLLFKIFNEAISEAMLI